MELFPLWQYGLLSFQGGKDFCLKIYIPKENCCILRIGVMVRYQKVPNFYFQPPIIRIDFCWLKIQFIELEIYNWIFLKIKYRWLRIRLFIQIYPTMLLNGAE